MTLLKPRCPDLLQRLSPGDLALVEGFKSERHPKLEVFRPVVGKPPLHPDDSRILGVACDQPLTDLPIPCLALDDVASIADFVIARALPLPEVLAMLAEPPALRR